MLLCPNLKIFQPTIIISNANEIKSITKCTVEITIDIRFSMYMAGRPATMVKAYFLLLITMKSVPAIQFPSPIALQDCSVSRRAQVQMSPWSFMSPMAQMTWEGSPLVQPHGPSPMDMRMPDDKGGLCQEHCSKPYRTLMESPSKPTPPKPPDHACSEPVVLQLALNMQDMPHNPTWLPSWQLHPAKGQPVLDTYSPPPLLVAR